MLSINSEIKAKGGADFALYLSPRGFSFFPKNAAAESLLEQETRRVAKDVRGEGNPAPVVFGIDLANVSVKATEAPIPYKYQFLELKKPQPTEALKSALEALKEAQDEADLPPFDETTHKLSKAVLTAIKALESIENV